MQRSCGEGDRDQQRVVDRLDVAQLHQARHIDAILVTELSRWGRSTQDLLDTLNRLSGWRVSVVAMSGMTFEVDTPHGRDATAYGSFQQTAPA